MTKAKVPTAPPGTRAGGKRLWSSVLDNFELAEHEMLLLREATRAVDVLDQLDAMVKKDGAIVTSARGAMIAHPAAVEARLQRVVLARLIMALRVPFGDESEPQGGDKRAQRRPGFRGVYGIRGDLA
jgi:hypothetical protein